MMLLVDDAPDLVASAFHEPKFAVWTNRDAGKLAVGSRKRVLFDGITGIDAPDLVAIEYCEPEIGLLGPPRNLQR
jgi:hypothetical protein